MAKACGARTALAVALLWSVACRLQDTEIPALSGPSELALSINLAVTPDAIARDGASQATISVTARNPGGGPVAFLPLRLDMAIRGVQQDLGTLSARAIQTGADGRAVAVYTAPPPPPPSEDAVTIVTILATPGGSNHQTAVTRTAEIRLTAPGVILPPAEDPSARFTFSPASPAIDTPVFFDASPSCAAGETCSSRAGLATFDWNFGDGTHGSGERPTHTFTVPGIYNVTLRVTNDRGLSASATVAVPVGAGVSPTASFVFSPTSPFVGQTVVFNAETSRAAPGQRLVDYSWRWGDDTPGRNGSNLFQATHVFDEAGTYVVVLTVVDDVGQRASATQTVSVGPGQPTPAFTVSPPATGFTGHECRVRREREHRDLGIRHRVLYLVLRRRNRVRSQRHVKRDEIVHRCGNLRRDTDSCRRVGSDRHGQPGRRRQVTEWCRIHGLKTFGFGY